MNGTSAAPASQESTPHRSPSPAPPPASSSPGTAPTFTFRPSVVAVLAVTAGALAGWLLLVALAFLIAAGTIGIDALLAFAVRNVLVVGPIVAAPVLTRLPLLFTRYQVDARGVQKVTQILSRNEQRIPWSKVTALVEDRNLFEMWLGLSRLTVVAYGEKGTTMTLHGVARPALVRDHVAERMRAAASVATLFSND